MTLKKFRLRYFLENNGNGLIITKPRSVDYGTWLATWNWQTASANRTLGFIVENGPRSYAVFLNDCYNCRADILNMLRPEMSCGRFRCKACGFRW